MQDDLLCAKHEKVRDAHKQGRSGAQLCKVHRHVLQQAVAEADQEAFYEEGGHERGIWLPQHLQDEA